MYHFIFRYFKYTKPPKKSVNNAKKLFTVLGTLAAITIGAVCLVILWYRVKAIFNRQQKQKKIVEQQRQVNSPSNNNHSTAPRYASSDLSEGSIHSAQLIGNRNQSQALITSVSPPITVYKNVEALANDSIQSYMDDENQQQQNLPNYRTTEIQANTQC
jgi:cytoskeletal protein RodZ